MKRLIARFWILVRKGCGLSSLRRLIRKNDREQSMLSREILASADASNETAQRTLKIVQSRLGTIVDHIDALLQSVSASNRDIDEKLSALRSSVEAERDACSGKLAALAGSLELAGSKEDLSALSEQLLRIRGSVKQIIDELEAMDKAQSLILINQVMDLAASALPAKDSERQ